MRYRRYREKLARKKSVQNEEDMYKNLNKHLIKKEEKLWNTAFNERLRNKEKIDKAALYNKKVKDTLSQFKKTQEALAEQNVRIVFNYRKEMADFLAGEEKKQRETEVRLQELHHRSARVSARKKQMQEFLNKESYLYAKSQLQKIHEKLNKSYDAYQTFNKHKAGKSLGHKGHTIKLNRTGHDISNRAVRSTVNHGSVSVKNSPMNRNKDYKEYFRYRESLDFAVKESAAKEVKAKEGRSELVKEHIKHRRTKMEEEYALRKLNHKENLERVHAHQFIRKKETLEKLHIPLHAYPSVAEAFN